MKAIILAAGRGSRLGPYTADKPKSLITMGGKPLIQRSVENIKKSGFDQVVVVLGYRHEMIESVLAENFPSDFYKVILNPDYTRGSASTLMCAAKEIEGDVVIVESDLLYDHRVLVRMSSPQIKQALAMGHFNHGRREVKIYLEGNGDKIAEAAWGEPDDTRANGDWVGFTRLSAASSAVMQKRLLESNPNQGVEIHYEAFVFELLKQFAFQSVYIQDLPWIEIDNEIDLKRAESEIYPQIDGLIPVAS